MIRPRLPLALALALTLAGRVAAQGTPTGGVRGQVVGPDGFPLSGVEIHVTSAALPVLRTAVTSANGDFIVPFLPPGEYALTFALAGFQSQTRTVRVAVAQLLPLTIELELAALADAVNVKGGGSEEVSSSLTAMHTYKASRIEHLPVGRTVTDAALLAPGVTANGPAGRLSISGALSYENLFLEDGIVFNGALVATPLPLYIEDAIQETSVATANISAEYGRFQGGVVNVVTRSGGNTFSGSFRTSLANEAWRALTPDPADERIDSLTPVYEFTVGGPVRKNATWFFTAGRFGDVRRTATLAYTGASYTASTLDRRGEVKLTQVWKGQHTIRGSYIRRGLRLDNTRFGLAMDLATLFKERTDFTLSAIGYTGILTRGFFVEGQYASKREMNRDRGSRFTDLVKGTPILDLSRMQARFNAAPFCAVCGGGWLERNENRDWFAKAHYFLSTRRVGSHDITAGVDSYGETRQNDNWQSGSGYEIEATTAGMKGGVIYPVFTRDNTHIVYMPLVAPSVGSDIRTYSGFVDDTWRYNARVTLNLGFRTDVNRSRDQAGNPVIKDGTSSPRVGVSWRLDESGTWTVNASLARYVAAVNTLFIDVASPAGRTANYSYAYQGPAINLAPPLIGTDQALAKLFEWFFSNDGLNRPTRNPPVIPGRTRQIGADARAPHAQEYSAGLADEMGTHGTWRVDVVSREYHNLYGEFVDATTGRYTDPDGREFDFGFLANDRSAKRSYRGVTASIDYRLMPAQFGATYTLSWSRGNAEGEGPTTPSFRTTTHTYPEYREARWNSPVGYTRDDQRHKLRAWMSLPLPVSRFGQFTLGLLQRFDSALPYDARGPIDSRPWITNAPKYVTPPNTVIYYFSPRYGLRWQGAWNSDVSVTWSKIAAPLRAELFFRGVLMNIFNNSAVLTGDSTVLTAANKGTRTDLSAFDPYHATPLRDVNWAPGPRFGQPIDTASYQAPRTFSCSAGFRF